MSTKYAVTERERWTLKTDVRLSDHALDRWDERVPEDSVSPEKAFEQSVDVSLICPMLEDKGGQIPDRARYWYEQTPTESYAVVFLICEIPPQTPLCKTIYPMDMIDHGPTRAYLNAHNNEIKHE